MWADARRNGEVKRDMWADASRNGEVFRKDRMAGLHWPHAHENQSTGNLDS